MAVDTNIVFTEAASDLDDLSDWLGENYPDLDLENLFLEQHRDIEARIQSIQNGNHTEHAMEELAKLRIAAAFGEYSTSQEILERQRSAFQQLIADAKETGVNGNPYGQLLNRVILTGIAPVLPELNQWAVDVSFSTISELCRNPAWRETFADSVMLTFAHGIILTQSERNSLFEAFDCISRRDYFPAPSLETLARHLFLALESEIKETASGDADCRNLIKLIDLSVALPSQDTFPTLLAVAQRHKSQEARLKADQALYDLEHSTARVWQEVVPDRVSNDATRAEIIKATIASSYSLKDKMIDIAAVVKQNPVEDWNSPLADALVQLLGNENESLKLLAARALLQRHDANIIITAPNQTLSTTINLLSKLSIDTHAPAAKEAALLMDTLETCPEEIRKIVHEAKTQASLYFIQRQSTGN